MKRRWMNISSHLILEIIIVAVNHHGNKELTSFENPTAFSIYCAILFFHFPAIIK